MYITYTYIYICIYILLYIYIYIYKVITYTKGNVEYDKFNCMCISLDFYSKVMCNSLDFLGAYDLKSCTAFLQILATPLIYIYIYIIYMYIYTTYRAIKQLTIL